MGFCVAGGEVEGVGCVVQGGAVVFCQVVGGVISEFCDSGGGGEKETTYGVRDCIERD